MHRLVPVAALLLSTAPAALDAAIGRDAWSTQPGGALGGGVVSYAVAGHQRIEVASGMVSSIWPTAKVNAAVIAYGLPR